MATHSFWYSNSCIHLFWHEFKILKFCKTSEQSEVFSSICCAIVIWDADINPILFVDFRLFSYSTRNVLQYVFGISEKRFWIMKSNQLMSIPFNGRANFDQIDFVKCNRERHTQTSYHVHICSFNKWPQIFAGSANIQLPRTLHWARTQCEFGKSVYYFLVNRFDSICRHAVRDQSRTFVGKDWSAKIYTYIFNPFLSHCVDGARANANVHKNDKKEEESHAEKCSH